MLIHSERRPPPAHTRRAARTRTRRGRSLPRALPLPSLPPHSHPTATPCASISPHPPLPPPSPAARPQKRTHHHDALDLNPLKQNSQIRSILFSLDPNNKTPPFQTSTTAPFKLQPQLQPLQVRAHSIIKNNQLHNSNNPRRFAHTLSFKKPQLQNSNYKTRTLPAGSRRSWARRTSRSLTSSRSPTRLTT